MADNVKITSGANSTAPDGTIVATDQVTWSGSSAHAQVMKILLGADGDADVLVDSGQQTSACSLPVVLASDQSAVAISGSLSASLVANPGIDIGDVTVNNGTGSSAVNVQDGGNSLTVDQSTHDNLNLNANVQQADADVAAGNALFVQPGTSAVFDVRQLVAASLQATVVDGGSSLTVDNAGTFAVQAAQSGGWNVTASLVGNDGIDIGNVDVTSIVPGTGATNLGKAEDAAHTSGDVGVMALAVRADTASQLAGTDGDYVPLITGASGHLRVEVGNLTGGSAVNVQDGGNSLTVDQSTHDNLNLNANLQVADADVAAGNPVPVSDAGGSLTVDGNISASLVSNPGVDIGDVTVNNGTGSSAVNVQDGGNSLTVDNGGTFAVQAAQSGAWAVSASANLQVGGTDVSNSNVVPVGDAGGTLTVDQSTHDNLNLNANLQIADVDVSATVPVPAAETPVASALYTPSAFDSAQLSGSDVVKNASGVLYGFSGYNSASFAQFIQIHNVAAVPASGVAPILFVRVPASSNYAWDSGKFGKLFSTGIVITNSTTGPTLTFGASDCWWNVAYK